MNKLLLHALLVAASAGLTALASAVSGVNFGVLGPVFVAAISTVAHYVTGLLAAGD